MAEVPPPTTPEPAKPDALVAAVRKLTVAVWAVAGAFFLMVCLYVLSYFQMTRRFMQAAHPSAAAATSPSSTGAVTAASPSGTQPELFEGKEFHDLSPEKQIQYATAILLTRHDRSRRPPGEVISEIVKLKPGTELHYKVGEDFMPMEHAQYTDTPGDGYIVFLTGSPADFQFATTYNGDRATGLSGESLADLRVEAKKTEK